MQGYIDLPNPFIYPLQGYIRGFMKVQRIINPLNVYELQIPFHKSLQRVYKGYIKMISHFINPYKRVNERVYVSSTNGKKGFIIRCTFINPLRVYYSTLIFYSVPYPVLVKPDRRLTLPYSLYLIILILYPNPTSTRRTLILSYPIYSPHLIILLLYPIRTSTRRTSPHPYLTVP